MTHISRTPADLAKLADIHPEYEAFIANGIQDFPDDLEGRRTAYQDLNQAFLDSLGPESAKGVIIQERTVTARDGYEIPIRTYKPEKALQAGPLIIAIHGGGYSLGGLVDEEGHCRLFVQQFAASCINIDYRRSPEHKVPYAANDCWDVLTWATSHAQELGADPSRGFVVEGMSAGAALADIMIHLARDEKLSPPITGAMEIAPYICHPTMIPERFKDQFISYDQDMPLGSLSRETMDLLHSIRDAKPEEKWTSPLGSWPGGHEDLPKIVLMVHGMDHLRDVALIYEKILREEAGVETRLHVFPGMPHGFNVILAGGATANAHLRLMMDGIRWLLKRQ